MIPGIVILTILIAIASAYLYLFRPFSPVSKARRNLRSDSAEVRLGAAKYLLEAGYSQSLALALTSGTLIHQDVWWFIAERLSEAGNPKALSALANTLQTKRGSEDIERATAALLRAGDNASAAVVQSLGSASLDDYFLRFGVLFDIDREYAIRTLWQIVQRQIDKSESETRPFRLRCYQFAADRGVADVLDWTLGQQDEYLWGREYRNKSCEDLIVRLGKHSLPWFYEALRRSDWQERALWGLLVLVKGTNLSCSQALSVSATIRPFLGSRLYATQISFACYEIAKTAMELMDRRKYLEELIRANSNPNGEDVSRILEWYDELGNEVDPASRLKLLEAQFCSLPKENTIVKDKWYFKETLLRNVLVRILAIGNPYAGVALSSMLERSGNDASLLKEMCSALSIFDSSSDQPANMYLQELVEKLLNWVQPYDLRSTLVRLHDKRGVQPFVEDLLHFANGRLQPEHVDSKRDFSYITRSVEWYAANLRHLLDLIETSDLTKIASVEDIRVELYRVGEKRFIACDGVWDADRWEYEHLDAGERTLCSLGSVRSIASEELARRSSAGHNDSCADSRMPHSSEA